MAQTDSILVAPLPKAVRMIGIPLAAFLLTGFFIIVGFPYHHLTNRAAAIVSKALGVEIQAADSGLTVGLDGPGFRFEDVTVETPKGDIYPVDTARFGPAWSFSWFLLEPTLFFGLESELGRARGKIRTGDAPAWTGTISDARLDDLGFLEDVLPIKLTGTLVADGSIATTAEGELDGPLGFAVRDGLLGHPNMPLDIPFETIDGAMVFGGESMVAIKTFELVGPMLEFSMTGTVGHGAQPQDRALALEVSFVNVKPQMRSIAETFGVTVGRDGSAQLRVSGTAAAPVVQ